MPGGHDQKFYTPSPDSISISDFPPFDIDMSLLLGELWQQLPPDLQANSSNALAEQKRANDYEQAVIALQSWGTEYDLVSLDHLVRGQGDCGADTLALSHYADIVTETEWSLNRADYSWFVNLNTCILYISLGTFELFSGPG